VKPLVGGLYWWTFDHTPDMRAPVEVLRIMEFEPTYTDASGKRPRPIKVWMRMLGRAHSTTAGDTVAHENPVLIPMNTLEALAWVAQDP